MATIVDLTAHESFTGRTGRRWTVGPEIGRGGTAVVFEVTSDDGVAGAAKVLSEHRLSINDELVERFRREAEHLRGIDHPHVIRSLDSADVDGATVLVLERAQASLNDVVRGSTTPVAMPQALAWLLQAAAGLDVIAQNGLVHRDISLKNLLLREDGSLVVADFGTVSGPGDVTITKDEGLGSLLFISPQQFDDAHTAAPSDDVYSLGQVGYYVLTGSAAFGAPPPISSVRRDTPPPLAGLVESMRAHEAARRPSAGGALADLVRFVPYVGLPNGPRLLGPDSPLADQLLSMEGRGAGGIDPHWAAAHEALERARLALDVCRGDASRALVDVWCDHCGARGVYLARERLLPCGACGRDAIEALGVPAGGGFMPPPERT
jgi:serine/threonine-protein kinase